MGRMWEERADHARREITALAASGLGLGSLHAEAIRVVERDVRTELTCWATIDPETLVISAMSSGETRIPAQYQPLLADAEYSPSEPHTFAEMARRHETLARLSDLPPRDQDRSARLRNVWRPIGVDRELRILFVSDGSCWGAAGLVRSGSDFTDRETEYLTAVAPAIASATRLAVRSEISSLAADGSPAIVVLDPRGRLRSATPEAQRWQERFDDIEQGRFMVMMRVMARGARSTASGGFRAHLRDGQGRWVLMHASTLVGSDDDNDVAVSIDPATGEHLTGMLFAAYGLTPRERDICRDVIAGASTAQIAAHLFVTQNTVQDHLKSVFAKVGVRSRGEMVARLQPHPLAA